MVISQDFAALAAVLPLLGFASYTRDTLGGRARPNPVSWSLWAAAPMIAFVAELATGTSVRVALVTFTLGAGPAMVVLAALVRRTPGPGHRAPLPSPAPAPPVRPGPPPDPHWRLTRFDYACGASGALALALWAITGHGNIAIAFAIAAEMFAAAPTIIKSWLRPESETVGTYAASGGGGGITLMTIAHWRFASYAFPLAVTAECALIIGLITLRPLLPGRGWPTVARTQTARATAAGAAAVVMTAVLAFVLYRLATALHASALHASDPAEVAPVQDITRLPPSSAFPHGRPGCHPQATRPSPAALPSPPVTPPSTANPSSHPSPTRRPPPSPAPTPRPSPTRSPSPYPSTPSPAPYPSTPSPTPSPSPYPSTPSPSPTPYSSSPSPSPSPSATYPPPTATS